MVPKKTKSGWLNFVLDENKFDKPHWSTYLYSVNPNLLTCFFCLSHLNLMSRKHQDSSILMLGGGGEDNGFNIAQFAYFSH